MDTHIIYSIHPVNKRLYVVFNDHQGKIQLNTGQRLVKAYRLDGFLQSTTEGLNDLQITELSAGYEVSLRPEITISVDSSKLETTKEPQIMGLGYVLELETK